ncbi:uncharacterized protein BO96DRAFT_440043 [Aspergillus niger CBS 101883]|uniref:uncharacterized protein n=1 Tax=Aspergillus lacticoffeatus (strain CBS 101883) TaxID=1450533 RepID=UPI000D7EC672|nr:uncharacterized protein BO96DRAFT_440043 [Aspergillus niger CBS 101883]PYH50313.1 hypothetical protein BO96DRAFT_440043 [Aspergillus niger CBS 101883]
MQVNSTARDCSPLVYSRSGNVSPSRPSTPSSFECFLILQGGRSSALEALPEEYQRVIFDVFFLKAENEWLRRSRKSAAALYEGTVVLSAELLNLSANDIQEALTCFHIGFAVAEQLIHCSRYSAAADVAITLQELIPAFEQCRRGLDSLRTAAANLEEGGRTFSAQIQKSNRSYAEFFGINYDQSIAPAAGPRTRRTR